MVEEQDKNELDPMKAKSMLEYMGFTEDYWDRIMTNGYSGGNLGSHEVRALITIARGEQPQILSEVYNQMRAMDGERPVETEGRLRSERKK